MFFGKLICGLFWIFVFRLALGLSTSISLRKYFFLLFIDRLSSYVMENIYLFEENYTRVFYFNFFFFFLLLFRVLMREYFINVFVLFIPITYCVLIFLFSNDK